MGEFLIVNVHELVEYLTTPDIHENIILIIWSYIPPTLNSVLGVYVAVYIVMMSSKVNQGLQYN